MFFGILFLVMGAVILLQHLGLIVNGVWNLIWVAFFILLGIGFIKKTKGGCWCCGYLDEKKKK